jgi:hypothetical protein
LSQAVTPGSRGRRGGQVALQAAQPAGGHQGERDQRQPDQEHGQREAEQQRRRGQHRDGGQRQAEHEIADLAPGPPRERGAQDRPERPHELVHLPPPAALAVRTHARAPAGAAE